MSDYSIVAYLLILIASEVFIILSSLYLTARNAQHTFPRLRLLRSCIGLTIGLLSLYLFHAGIVGNWTAFVTVAVLYFLNTLVYVWMMKWKKGKAQGEVAESASLKQTDQAKWEKVKAGGKRRYILRETAVYGTVMLGMMTLSKIILKSDLLISVFVVIVLAGMVAGATSAHRRWKYSEQKYSRKNEADEVAQPNQSLNRTRH